jgi:phage shock protein A
MAEWLEKIFKFLADWRKKQKKEHKRLIMLIDDLNTSIANLTTAVNALAVAYTSEPSNAQLQAAITNIASVTATATAALNPPVTPPPATP